MELDLFALEREGRWRSDRDALALAAAAAGLGPVLCFDQNRNCMRVKRGDGYWLFDPLNSNRVCFSMASAVGLFGQAPVVAFAEDLQRSGVARDEAYRIAFVAAAAEVGAAASLKP